MKKKLYYKVYTETKAKNKSKDFISVEVNLLEKTQVFGRYICKVEPVAGEGHLWVNENTLTIK